MWRCVFSFQAVAYSFLNEDVEMFFVLQGQGFQILGKYIRYMHIGVSLNGGTPKTPQNDHF